MKNLSQLNIASSEKINATTVKGGTCDDRKRLLTFASGATLQLDATTGKMLQKAWGGTTLGGYTVTAINGTGTM